MTIIASFRSKYDVNKMSLQSTFIHNSRFPWKLPCPTWCCGLSNRNDSCRSPSLNLVSPAQFPTIVARSQDPVVAGDGFTYERSCIEDWLKERTSKTARFVALIVEAFLAEILEMGSFFRSLVSCSALHITARDFLNSIEDKAFLKSLFSFAFCFGNFHFFVDVC